MQEHGVNDGRGRMRREGGRKSEKVHAGTCEKVHAGTFTNSSRKEAKHMY